MGLFPDLITSFFLYPNGVIISSLISGAGLVAVRFPITGRGSTTCVSKYRVRLFCYQKETPAKSHLYSHFGESSFDQLDCAQFLFGKSNAICPFFLRLD
jgi:hypothetical protein